MTMEWKDATLVQKNVNEVSLNFKRINNNKKKKKKCWQSENISREEILIVSYYACLSELFIVLREDDGEVGRDEWMGD